jgi:hypothetical protein
MLQAIESNNRSLRWRMRAYRATVVVLLLEVIVLLLALIVGRR